MLILGGWRGVRVSGWIPRARIFAEWGFRGRWLSMRKGKVECVVVGGRVKEKRQEKGRL